jgi:hypothetical protein
MSRADVLFVDMCQNILDHGFSTEGQKVLVIHNLASSSKTVSVQDDMSKPLAVLGEVSRNGNDLILGANSSAVFQL